LRSFTRPVAVSSSLAAWRAMVAPRGTAQDGPSSIVTWTAVVPVKDLSIAKSRLPYPPEIRASLALAMARDVIAALLATRGIRRVVVVTDDPTAAEVFLRDTVVIADEPRAGLSAALSHGAAVAFARWPTDGVLAVASDLPALTPAAVAAVLAAAPDDPPCRFVVADALGSGTALLAAPPGLRLNPRFEGDSLAAHVAGGASDLTAYAPAGLRQDVDTADDMTAVLALGAGPVTLRTLRMLGFTG
jgi:2-phospho-L-lactate guanylyltransferase